MSIAVMLIVCNEEKRIAATLDCLKWCDEIFVLDRNSKDATAAIAKKYTDKVFPLMNQDFRPEDGERVLREAKSDWIFSVTASDLIHPGLAKELKRLTDVKDSKYNVIRLPFRRYVLGLETARSPWYTSLNSGLLFKKSVAEISTSSVHGAISFRAPVYHEMQESVDKCMYHLTHISVDALMDRHVFYLKSEAALFPANKTLWTPLVDVLRGLYVVVIRRGTILMGWDGMALAMAYLSYWILRFVYIWEKRYSKAPETYAEIYKFIGKAWEEQEAGKAK